MAPMRSMQYSQFCEYLTNIKYIIQFQDLTDNLTSRYNRKTKDIATIIYPTLVDDVIRLLEWATGDLDAWISYYIYELDFGRKYKDGCVTNPDGSIVKLKTVKDLWNLLEEDYRSNNRTEDKDEQNSAI